MKSDHLDQTIKGLSEKLHNVRSSFVPRQKFSFKSARKINSTATVKEELNLPSHQRPQLPSWDLSSSTSVSATAEAPAIDTTSEQEAQGIVNKELRDNKQTGPRNPSFSQSKTISFSNQSHLHIILPSSASHAITTGTLSNLQHCIVDMSLPTTLGQPFSGISLKNIKVCLVICGRVSGPAHVTNLEDTVIVTTCRQLRMHECKRVDVYLHCSSRPIIENCSQVRFAPLPDFYVSHA